MAGPKISPWALFRVFFGISAVTIGGGYAMVPVIGRSLEKRGWVGEDDFYELFAQAQCFPGPIAFTTALISGSRLAGTAGAAAAGTGVVLPPFFAIVIVGALLGRIGSYPLVRDFLAGAGATVPGLVAAMVWSIAKKRRWSVSRAFSVALLAAALAFFPALTLPLFFGGAILFYMVERRCGS